MIEAGAVGATFEIKNLASATLRELLTQFEALSTKVEAAQDAMRSLTFPSELTASMSRLDEAFLSIGESAAKGADAAKSSLAGIDESIAATTTAVARLKREMRELGSGGGGSREPSIRNTAGHGSSGHSPLGRLLHPIGHGMGLPSAVMGTALGPEGIALGAIGYGAVKAVEAGAALQGEGVNMSLGGNTQSEVSKALEASIKLGSKYGFNADAVAKMLNEIRAPLSTGTPDSGMEAALGIADNLMQFATIARRVGGEKGDQALDQMYAAIKSGEMRNVLSPEDYAKFIANEGQIFAATGGRVAPSAMLQAIAKAKTEGMTISDDFVHYSLPAYVQEFGGPQSGTMLGSAYAALIGGHATKKSKLAGQALGLYDDGLNFKFQDEFMRDPTVAFQKIGEALKAHGFTTEEEIGKEIGKFTSNRQVGEFIAKSIMGAQQLGRTTNAVRGAESGATAANNVLANDPATAWDRITSGLSNFAAAFTGPQMSGITSGLNSFADALNAAVGPTKAIADNLVALQSWFDRNNVLKRTADDLKADPARVAHANEFDRLSFWEKLKMQFGPLPAHPETVGRNPRSGLHPYTPPPAPVVIPPPTVHVEPASATVNVYLDSELLARASSIDTRTVNGTFDHDGRQGFASPDVRN
jgi:hypothetical protein